MTGAPHTTHRNFTRTLQRWFAVHGRDLPWRHTRDPYRIWVAEIMLQQTQVDRVIDFYQRFLTRFPTIKKLAAGRWPQVLTAWRGLGYYGRARNMQKAARVIVARHGGCFPRTIETLEELPGIGPYTARAIAVFAHEEDHLVLDTNTRRVLTRMFGSFTDQIVPRGKAWNFHQALMDFGATVCTMKDPQCPTCPMRSWCQYAVTGDSAGGEPPATRSTRTRHCRPMIQVAVGIIHRDGHILIARRGPDQHLAGYWEFPGGKRRPQESGRECLKREIKEELGLEVAVRPHDWSAEYDYGDRIVRLRFHRCSILRGRSKQFDDRIVRWVTPSSLKDYRFPPANQSVIKELATARFPDPHL